MAKSILKLSNISAGVKIYDAEETIALATDLKLATEDIVGTPTVDIYGIYGSNAATVTRNGVVVFKSTGTDPFRFEFSQMEMKDTTENTSDIVVTVAADAQCYLILRKSDGYRTTIEPEQFGSYDNPAVRGS